MTPADSLNLATTPLMLTGVCKPHSGGQACREGHTALQTGSGPLRWERGVLVPAALWGSSQPEESQNSAPQGLGPRTWPLLASSEGSIGPAFFPTGDGRTRLWQGWLSKLGSFGLGALGHEFPSLDISCPWGSRTPSHSRTLCGVWETDLISEPSSHPGVLGGQQPKPPGKRQTQLGSTGPFIS